MEMVMFTTTLVCEEFDCHIVYRVPDPDITTAIDHAIQVMAAVGGVDPSNIREFMPPPTNDHEYVVWPDNDMIWTVTITKEN